MLFKQHMNPSQTYRNAEWLSSRVRQLRAPAEIADECDVSIDTIIKWIDRHQIVPYREKEWLETQINKSVPPETIARCCDVSEATIRRWLKKHSLEKPGRPSERILMRFLDSQFGDLQEVSKKTQIEALKSRYGNYVGIDDIAEVVGCHRSYAHQVIQGGYSASYRRSEDIPGSLRRRVVERDSHACVKCGSDESDELEIHHIIPGESKIENLAVLCHECHILAHGGSYSGRLEYDSIEGFWNGWI